ncbi:GNAT family N-acetyltransferase [Halobacillus sp. Marseille-Q1614]|uniref:GNAT family N-acetyltransferase n=1 Tax=Halobacillus sp. Marseille-Q1614 TaxID=2709134 RepID=UPI001570EF01|nr:GNAT family N-acetyltransferase [Halobacillus sp. Marseille-Q1614]
MNITHATTEEINEILPRVQESLEEGSRGYYEVDQDKASRMMQDVLSQDGQIQVVTEEGQVVGWVVYGQQDDRFSGEKVGFIYDLFLRKEYRGKGYARALMDSALRELKLQGMTSVRLVVYAGNHARALYEKLGFTEQRTVMAKKL